MTKKGFTLIELLVVISIIGILSALILSNLNDARARARDSQKKSELTQLKTALRLYYNDYQKYPAKCGTNTIQGCGASGTTCCPVAGCPEFAAGGTGCETAYMKKLPVAEFTYVSSDDDSFTLAVTLENASDADLAASQTVCLGAPDGSLDFYVCSD